MNKHDAYLEMRLKIEAVFELFLAKTPQACESRRVTMLRATLDAIHSSLGSSFGEEQD